MIYLDRVTFSYPGTSSAVLDDLSISVEAGEFISVLGGNGSGKTSFCRVLTGLIPHFYRGGFSGTATVNGLAITDHPVATLAGHVGYVYQDFENQLLRPRVGDDVAFSAVNYGHQDHHERARRAMQFLGIDHLADRIIWELSGGERHLVAIAGALALDPAVLVIDEPISQLDPIHARTVYERLGALNRETGTTIVVVEHFTEFVGEFCTHAALLESGTLRWKLSSREALGRIDELEEAGLAPPPVTRIAYSLGMSGQLPVTVEETRGRIAETFGSPAPAAIATFSKGKVRGARSAARAEGNPEVLARFREFGHYYLTLSGKRHQVLTDVDLEITSGERIAIVGGNGSGKSTLLKILAGIARPRAGSVEVCGLDTRKHRAETLSEWVSLVYQQAHEMFIEDSVRGDIGYFLHQRHRPDAGEVVDELIVEFGLQALAERDGRLLSGGQMRRASLAIAAGMQPRLLLLDEPTSSLDVANRTLILAMLERLDRWVSTAIIATHDMELVARWADRVISVADGGILSDLPTRAFFEDSARLRAARVREPQVVELSKALTGGTVALDSDEFLQMYERETCQ